MTTQLDPTLLPALAAIERGPRREIDKRQLLSSLQRLDYDMRLRHYPAIVESDDPRDAEQYFLDEQCPSDRSFR